MCGPPKRRCFFNSFIQEENQRRKKQKKKLKTQNITFSKSTNSENVKLFKNVEGECKIISKNLTFCLLFPTRFLAQIQRKPKKNKILPEHECFQSASFLFSSHSLLSRNNLLTRSLILLCKNFGLLTLNNKGGESGKRIRSDASIDLLTQRTGRFYICYPGRERRRWIELIGPLLFC